jgi:hypothetical protein
MIYESREKIVENSNGELAVPPRLAKIMRSLESKSEWKNANAKRSVFESFEVPRTSLLVMTENAKFMTRSDHANGSPSDGARNMLVSNHFSALPVERHT